MLMLNVLGATLCCDLHDVADASPNAINTQLWFLIFIRIIYQVRVVGQL